MPNSGTLRNQSRATTFPGLVKTTSNSQVDGNFQNLQNGDGKDLPIEVKEGGVRLELPDSGFDASRKILFQDNQGIHLVPFSQLEDELISQLYTPRQLLVTKLGSSQTVTSPAFYIDKPYTVVSLVNYNISSVELRQASNNQLISIPAILPAGHYYIIATLTSGQDSGSVFLKTF